MSTKFCFSILFLMFFVAANAQLPVTNLYMFTMTKGGGKVKIDKPKYLTAFNKNGYNNQPYFFEDDIVYFTTNYYSSDQTEIAKFDFFDEVLTRVTYTEESEYSPTSIPGKDEFSCIRVESDQVTQTLSVYPLDGIGYPKRYMNNTKNLGYHAWIDKNTLGLFLVEEPYHNLAIADSKSERRKIILDKIGRTLKVSREGKLVFVHKLTEDQWYIKEYDNTLNRSTTLAPTLEGKEDFELLNDGSILMGSGSELFRFDPANSASWEKLADLSDFGIEDITRIAARKNRLLIVNQGT
ncbi:MAG: hypothetical protein KJO29_11785 [Bacteroidia bacterium]|nr:hypothetical protein [Bacteroidia bacterium]